METAYRNWDKKRREKTYSHRTAGKSYSAVVSIGKKERRRLLQLGTCIILFLVVFVGKGVFPEQLTALRGKLVETMGMDTDFKMAFSNLGRAISAGEPVADTLGELWTEVFAGGTVAVPYQPTVENGAAYLAEKAFIAKPLTVERVLEHRFGIAKKEVLPVEPLPPLPEPVPPPAPEPEVEHVDYAGPALPEYVSMDKYKLGLAATISPVSDWWVASNFGWRDHPVDDVERFHNGVDLAVNDGTAVKAFADGVVDYIGESPIYGLYTQLKHANGVTTFYAHCSKLCVQQGQTVKVGDVIALSGETGNVTGPHLHLEIRRDGMLLNPLYYIEHK